MAQAKQHRRRNERSVLGMTNEQLRKWAKETWNYAPSEVEEAIIRLLDEYEQVRKLLQGAQKYLRDVCEYEPDICVDIDRALHEEAK